MKTNKHGHQQVSSKSKTNNIKTAVIGHSTGHEKDKQFGKKKEKKVLSTNATMN